MPAKKYVEVDTTTGLPKERSATVVSAGVGNDGDLVALNSSGKLDTSVLPTVGLTNGQALALATRQAMP